jgi:hypothetical protein
MDPLAPCPYTKRGNHTLSVIIPETSEEPAVLFCDACGVTRHVALRQVAVDDLTAEAIEQLIRSSP